MPIVDVALHTFAGTQQFMTVIVTKKIITPKKVSVWQKPLSALLILVAVPVIVIALISLLVFYLVFWLGKKIFKPQATNEEKYHLRLEFIRQPKIGVWLVEDEEDLELMRLNELWADEVYAQETSLFRIETSPLLPALEGRLCCHYLKEMQDGTLLQLLPDNKPGHPLDTCLVYLDHQSRAIMVIDEIGPFHLYNDEKDNRLIKGFSNKNTIEITIAGSAIPDALSSSVQAK